MMKIVHCELTATVKSSYDKSRGIIISVEINIYKTIINHTDIELDYAELMSLDTIFLVATTC